MVLRKIIVLLLSLTFCWTTVACSSPSQTQSQPDLKNSIAYTPTKLADGKYPIQQANYNDANGEYNLMLLNATPPLFRTTDLQMARLTDEEIKAGEETYLQIADNKPVMHLTEDFKIEYVHNVTETQTNPQTGQTQTVVVRRESSFWTPFAGALAGQALGSLLFTPQYYVPPMYSPGGIMTGYGGYGRTYDVAVNQYQNRYQTPPPAVTNRQTLRTTGSINKTPTSSNRSTTTYKNSSRSTKSTGSGYGASNLSTSGKSTYKKRTGSFGSSSFGSRKSYSRSGRRR